MTRWDDDTVRLFDVAAEYYDAARPSYPSGIYDLLGNRIGGLAAKRVADGGTGTGIVARQLLERGADVIAYDPGLEVLRRATIHTPTLHAMVAEAGAVPVRAHVSTWCASDKVGTGSTSKTAPRRWLAS
jgi:hypothetical protein